MRGLPWLISLVALFASPAVVIVVWFWVFNAVGRSSPSGVLALLAATGAAGLVALAFLILGAWVFRDVPPDPP